MKTRNLISMSIVLVLGFVLSTQAAVISAWDNDDITGSETSTPADTTLQGFSVATLSYGSGLGSGGWADAFDTTASFTSTSLANAIANNDYMTFTIQPGGLVNDLDYTDFDFRAEANSTGFTADLLTSATGFTSSDSLSTFTHNGSPAVQTFNADLSGVAALQNNTGNVEFRLYIYNLGNRMGIGDAFATDGLNDLFVSGNADVATTPEPTTFGLIGLGFLGILAQRKRLARKDS